jgi:pimeloyl-ACP methyl ester carboxylesterase
MRTGLAICVVGMLVVAGCTADQDVTATRSRPAGPTSDPITSDPDTSTPDTSAPDTSDDADTDSLAWGSCQDDSANEPALECATLTVPLDYDQPDGDSIDLALVRLPATDDRIGAILLNPGGPGGSGFEFTALSATSLQSGMGLAGFDLVGFDPRGVDRSNGIRCLTDEQVDATAYLDDTPDDDAERAALDAADSQFETACIDVYGDTLRHYSTVNTARDMDRIRAAMGDDQISYLGISYGTYLGAMYATLFPDRVRAMVLDAAFEPTGDSVEEQYTTQLVGFSEAFDNWAAWCTDEPSCAFQSDDVPGAWDALMDRLDAEPAPATDGREANEAVGHTATISALYSESEWPVLAQALDDASVGDGDGLFRLADSYIGRNDDGTYDTIDQSGHIIRCASGIDAAAPADPEALAARLLELSPRFAEGITADDFDDSCDALMPDVTPTPLSYDGDAPIVVVGGLNDPATPIRWAEEMTAAMGDTARLVTYSGEGHGFVLTASCVTEAEANVLIDLELPEEGLACDPDPDVPEPDWWADTPTPQGVSDVVQVPEALAALGITPDVAWSELRLSDSLDPDGVLAAYEPLLTGAGFVSFGTQEPVPGVQQAVYQSPGDEAFSVLVLGEDALGDPDLGNLAEVLPEGTQTLVVLIAIPF